jgi:arylsulfatase A-like enzyme
MSRSRRPNVLIVVADDQRFDTIGTLWNENISTPNLDRLVESGCSFTNAHNMGSDTAAVCVPARSMIHSGRSLFHLDGPGGMTIEHPTLPEAFGNAGYRTFATGKWHNGTEAFNRCYQEGRNIFFSGMGNHWNVPVTDRHPLGEYRDERPRRFCPGTGRVETFPQPFERYASGTHSSDLFADSLIEFLVDHDSSTDERPFFAYLAFMAPHDPRTAPGTYQQLYDPVDVQLPENFNERHPFDNGHLHVRDEELATHPRDPDEIRRHIADYYAMISHLDAQVGRVRETLESRGMLDDTIVVFTADHGLAVGQHGLMGKQNLYDHSVRVPLVFTGPTIPSGACREAFTYHHDLYPTLASFCDVEVPGSVDGENLQPVVAGDRPGHRNSVFTAFAETQRAVRTDEHKLLEYTVDGARRTQLFDVRADPAETVDVSDEPGNSALINQLRTRLTDWQERVDDPGPTDW